MSLVKHFKKNEAGRDLIIGDIHGHFSKAYAALLSVGFDPETDRVFSAGDLVDRGPESIDAIEWLNKPWFHAVRGNHEQMCIERCESYLHTVNGGAWFVGMTLAEQQPYVDAFSDLPAAILIETSAGPVGVVHADPVADTWARLEQRLGGTDDVDGFMQALIWSRDRISSGFDAHIPDVRAVVVGHTPVERMTSLGNVFYIDTGGWLPESRFPGKSFTVLDAETLEKATSPVREVMA